MSLERKRRFLASLAFLLACAGIDVARRGGIAETLRLPARVDPATPAAQPDFSLLAVQRADNRGACTLQGVSASCEADTTALWIAPLSWPAVTRPARPFVATGRTITAPVQTFPLEAHIAADTRGGRLLLVTIPPHYPSNVSVLDVLVRDANGRSATWRLDRLPRTVRGSNLQSALRSVYADDQVTARARATRDTAGRIWCEVTPTFAAVARQPGLHWETGLSAPVYDWMPRRGARRRGARRPEALSSLSGGYNWLDPAAPPRAFRRPLPPSPTVPPTPLIGFTAVLRPIATHDEMVVFHNVEIVPGSFDRALRVDRDQTTTTPSGVRVTLPAQAPPEPGGYATNSARSDLVHFRLHVDPLGREVKLPRSPLLAPPHFSSRQPVTLSIDFPPPFNRATGYGPDGSVQFSLARTAPRRLKYFPVIVRQRVEGKPITMPFTVVVEEAKKGTARAKR